MFYCFVFQTRKEPVYADLCHPNTRPAAPLVAASQPVTYADLKVQSPNTHIAKILFIHLLEPKFSKCSMVGTSRQVHKLGEHVGIPKHSYISHSHSNIIIHVSFCEF